MIFNFLDDLITYFKWYGKMFGFEETIQRSYEGEDLSVRYVTIACDHGRKTWNMTSIVGRPCLTWKMGCTTKIHAYK